MLSSLTIHEAAVGLREKKFSSVELAKSCLERIRSLEPKLNAFVHVAEKSALEDAKNADNNFASGKTGSASFSSGTLSPLTGIPVAFKDVFSVFGMPNTACSNILKNFTPPYDATTVKALKKAGVVILGKTNTDEFTCGGSTETSCFGVTKNPWDFERVAGGSSGGSAAAVAANECLAAFGTDTGGSIRQPASFCGVTGLKVTYGRVSRFGVISMASSLDSIGPLAKDVEDIALIMNVIAGSDPHDSTTPPRPVPDYSAAAAAPAALAALKGLRIGLPREYFIPGMDAQVEKSVREAVKVLEKNGAKVKEISLPHTKYALAVYYIICPSEVSANMARYDGIRFGPGPSKDTADLYDYYATARGEGFGDEMKRRIMTGTYALSAGYYEAYYLKAQKVRTLIIQDFVKAFEEVDVICAPIAPTPAFKIGENTADPVKMYLEDVFTVAQNVAGVPSLAVPCGFSAGQSTAGALQNEAKLPIGMQIIGPQFGEEKILGAGAAFQQLTDWHTRKPLL